MANGKGMKRPDKIQGSSVPANGRYITDGDLLALATKRHCQGIVTKPVLALCRPEKNFWVFKATVYKSPKCRGFVGYGDAHPGNVSPLIFNHAEMRMAETRAVNRALRKAYGIGLCSPENHSPACRFSDSHAGTGVGFMAFKLTSYPNLRRVLTSF
jgi:hypothetical protein